MSWSPGHNHTTWRALRGIQSAIRGLTKPRAVGLAGFANATRVENQKIPGYDEVLDDLIGAAFAIAQTYLKTRNSKTPTTVNVEHAANYWKHRDEWDSTWAPKASSPMSAKTIAAVRALGIAPPVAAGQMADLAEKILGRPFEVSVLWKAIA